MDHRDGTSRAAAVAPGDHYAAEGNDKRAWYLSLTRSLDNLRGLRRRVEDELLPAMDREADEIAGTRRRRPRRRRACGRDRGAAGHPRPVGRRLLARLHPFAHGIRLFGQFYNEASAPRTRTSS